MKKFHSFLAFALAILCLSAPFAQVASATELPSSATEGNALDFSSNDDYMLRAVLSPSDLLTLLLETVYENETPISEAEQKYLDRYFSDYLYYDGLLPASLLSTEKTDQSVTVTAQGYSYQANNGRTVTYLPVRAQIGTKEMTLTPAEDGQSFFAEFTDLPSDGDLSAVTVFYQGSITLPKEKVNQLLSMAYRDAQSANNTPSMPQYAAALKEYQQYLQAMEQYEAASVNYEIYLSSLALYEKAVQEYEQNQRDWEAYPQKEANYQAYLKEYELYEQKKAKYDLDHAEYLKNTEQQKAYTKNILKIRTALHPMESLFLTPTNGKTGTLYKGLQNAELVVMFEKYQGILSSNFGIPKKTITDLRADADQLNELLGGYNDARNISEEKAFSYYKEHYDEICTLFNSLYQRMEDILKPAVYNIMCAKLELEYPEDKGAYKKWRIKNVLAHIYLICLCLDDERTPNNTWTFFNDAGEEHTYYFSDLLSQNLIISDSDSADPSNLTWISKVPEMSAPIAPTEPTVVQKPIQPATLEEPKPPVEVAKPIEPTRMEEPLPPLESDLALILRTGEICAALGNGELSERQELTEDPTILLPEVSVEKRIGAPSVFGKQGKLLPVTDLTDLPEPSEDSELLPLSFDLDYATYTFDGWSEPISTLNENASEDTCVYAKYRRAPQSFTANFVVDGQTFSQTVSAGETPVFEGSTKKDSTETLDYIFTTWDPPLAPTYSDMEYVAQYQEKTRSYTVAFAMEQQTLTQHYEWQQMPTVPLIPPSYYSGGSLYEFESWDKELAPVTEDTVYTARYCELVLAELPDGENGSLSVAPSATGYVLVSSTRKIVISELVAKAIQEGKRLEILFSEDKISLTLDTDALKSLYRQNIHKLLLDRDPTYGTAIRCFKNDGREISLLNGELRVTAEHSFATDENIYLSAYYPSLDSYQWDVACASTSQTTQWISQTGVYYRTYRRYTLTLNVGEHGQVMANATLYSEGEKIQLTIRPDTNYRLSSLTFTDPIKGTTVKADPQNLVMPAWNAVLNAEFSPVEYRIEFVYHNQSTVQTYPFGATVIFPEIPMSFEEDGYFYTFIGWSSTESIVTGDMTYVANYHSIPIEEVADSGEGGAWRALILHIVLPLAIIVLLILSVIIVVPIIVVKQVKKKRKNPPSEKS